jgi:hypothetical protein
MGEGPIVRPCAWSLYDSSLTGSAPLRPAQKRASGLFCQYVIPNVLVHRRGGGEMLAGWRRVRISDHAPRNDKRHLRRSTRPVPASRLTPAPRRARRVGTSRSLAVPEPCWASADARSTQPPEGTHPDEGRRPVQERPEGVEVEHRSLNLERAVPAKRKASAGWGGRFRACPLQAGPDPPGSPSGAGCS